jgi:hypothetical protein
MKKALSSEVLKQEADFWGAIKKAAESDDAVKACLK